MLFLKKMTAIDMMHPLINLRDLAAILAFIIISSLTGCIGGPEATAEFFIESELKGNDGNARSLVVSDQQDEYSNDNTVMKMLFPKMGTDEPRLREIDAIARIIASSLILKTMEQATEKIVYEYSFDTDIVRDKLKKRGIASENLINISLREYFLDELEKFSHRLVLVKEKDKWKVDYRASK